MTPMPPLASPSTAVKTVVRAAFLVAAVAPAASFAQAPPPAAPKVVYLNFSDGTETLTFAAEDDAASNRSSTGAAMPYPAFSWPSINTGAITRAELIRRVVRRVHEIFLPYNVLVTTTRPPAGPYTMVMIGGHPRDIGIQANVAGLAFMDCRNEVASDIVFAFPEMLRGSEHGLEVTIAQEAAHGFGLEHTVNRRDIMYPTVVMEQALFPDEEGPIFDERLCGNSTQNSHKRLLSVVGPWLGDEKPIDDGTRADRKAPAVIVLDPAAGSEVGQPFVVRVAAEDEGGIDHVVLAAEGDRGTLYRAPYRWSLAGFAPGPLTLTVTAYDASGNTTTETATVTVTGTAPPLAAGCTLGPAGRFRGSAPLPTAAITLAALAALLTCIRRSRPL
jgi:hypothetical protein